LFKKEKKQVRLEQMGFSLREFGTIQVMMMMIIGATYEMLIL
jgi:hypothetical protein